MLPAMRQLRFEPARAMYLGGTGDPLKPAGTVREVPATSEGRGKLFCFEEFGLQGTVGLRVRYERREVGLDGLGSPLARC